MKTILPLLLSLLSFSSFSQTVEISGRFYYDANGNNIFDGTDSVLAYRRVWAIDSLGVFHQADTDGAGEYYLTATTGPYDLGLFGNIAYEDYTDINYQHRDFLAAGAYRVDFAYQKRDSIVSINIYIENANNDINIPGTGGSRQYKLTYTYDGFLQSMPAMVTLNFNPMLTLVSSSLPPSVTGTGKLQWDFPELPRNNPLDSIILTFNYPAVGDTIGSFILSPKFIPGITVTSNYNNFSFDFYQNIDFPVTQPIGPTNGVKWLRHFEGRQDSYDECLSIDTTQNGDGYFIAGYRSRLSDSTSYFQSPPFIAKLNNDGLSVWEKYLDKLPVEYVFDYISAIKHTGDGGCIALGSSSSYDMTGIYTNKIIVARFDSTGNFVWSKALSGSGYSGSGEDFVVLADGSSLVIGETSSHDRDFTNNNADTVYSNVFVAKLSPTGSIIFTKVYGGGKSDYGYRIKALQNGSFLVLAGTSSNDGDVVGAHQSELYHEEAWILNIDGNGNIIWSKCFGGSKDSYLSGAADNNGGILLTGYTDSKDGDLPYYPEIGVSLWALQISGTGDILWSRLHKLYNGYQDTNYIANPEILYDNSIYSSLHKTKDGNFLVGGTAIDKYGEIKSKHGEGDFVIVKLNASGDILWQKAIGGTHYDYISDIQVDKNDDIIFVGSSGSDNDDLYQHSSSHNYLMVVGKAGITNIIKGQVFVDNNANHIKDAGEHYYSQGRINSVKAADTTVARIFDGRFLNNVGSGSYISTYKPANNYYAVYPATHITSFAGLDLKDSFDFALTPGPDIRDLEIQLLPLSTPRPGFDATYRIITKNVGTATINNVVIGFKKDSRQSYLEASRPYTGILADSVWWGPFTLNAFDIDTLVASVRLAPPPTLNNGDTISLSVTANPVINDSSIANNLFSIREIVRGSFDPNDKTEIHAGTLTTTQYANGEWLQYMVRFQNTGTDTAFFITVKDTLQSGTDLNSLEIVSASHPYTFRLNGNVATWDFKKIQLPDSTTDEADSHGYILFKIKPKTALTVGDEFTNKAAIYFDYNLPVMTNQDRTVIGKKGGICPGGNMSFTAGITGTGYQWQVNAGAGFTDLTNAGIYSGVNTSMLVLTAPPTSMSGYRYRCVADGIHNSPENKLSFSVRWKGDVNSAWENEANWDCGKMPDQYTDVIIPAASSYPLISSNASCYSLRLSPGSVVNVMAGVKLTITGKAN